MSLSLRRGWAAEPQVSVFSLIVLLCWSAPSDAYVLVADRPQNRILKYSDAGAFLGVVVQDAANLGGVGNASGPNAISLSPDYTKLFVTSLNGSVVRYDFTGYTTMVATNPFKITSAAITDPGGVLTHPDMGSTTFHVSNRGFGFADNIAQFNYDGTPAGAGFSGGGFTGRTGLARSPNGSLLAGTFGTDFMGGGPGGGVLSYDADGTVHDLVPASSSLAGVASLHVHGSDLYVTASVGPDFQGRIGKFNVLTGAPDASFGTGGLITPPLSFAAGLTGTNDGAGFLVSMLTFATTGAGRIDRYLYDGTHVGVWANNSSANPALGFVEATAILSVVVPEPATAAGGMMIAMGLAGMRRRSAIRRS
jgi:hypothetical protein